MMMRILIYQALLIFDCVIAFAAPGVSDPNRILEQVEQYLGTPTFEQSFHSGDAFSLKNTSCLGQHEEGPCDTMTILGQVTVNSTQDRADVAYTVVGGNNSNPETYSKTLWEQNRGSALTMHLSILSSSGFSVQMQSAQRVQSKVIINGTEQPVSVMRVELDAVSASAIKIHETIDISRDLRGLTQLISLKKINSGLFSGTTAKILNEVWFK